MDSQVVSLVESDVYLAIFESMNGRGGGGEVDCSP